jgi:lipocalin
MAIVVILIAFIGSLVVSPASVNAGGRPIPSRCATLSTVDNFDLQEYIRYPWFVHEQNVNNYQPIEELFCVVAQYKESETENNTLDVYNSASIGSVTGEPANENVQILKAIVPDLATSSKLKVGPGFIPGFLRNLLFGPYWIVSIGDNYEWAIISGGQPNDEMPGNLCSVEPRFDRGGLWFFTRVPTRNQTLIDLMVARVISLGIYPTDLQSVEQNGCDYSNVLTLGLEEFPASCLNGAPECGCYSRDSLRC